MFKINPEVASRPHREVDWQAGSTVRRAWETVIKPQNSELSPTGGGRVCRGRTRASSSFCTISPNATSGRSRCRLRPPEPMGLEAILWIMLRLTLHTPASNAG